jgi:hypothetical protein
MRRGRAELQRRGTRDSLPLSSIAHRHFASVVHLCTSPLRLVSALASAGSFLRRCASSLLLLLHFAFACTSPADFTPVPCLCVYFASELRPCTLPLRVLVPCLCVYFASELRPCTLPLRVLRQRTSPLYFAFATSPANFAPVPCLCVYFASQLRTCTLPLYFAAAFPHSIPPLNLICVSRLLPLWTLHFTYLACAFRVYTSQLDFASVLRLYTWLIRPPASFLPGKFDSETCSLVKVIFGSRKDENVTNSTQKSVSDSNLFSKTRNSAEIKMKKGFLIALANGCSSF